MSAESDTAFPVRVPIDRPSLAGRVVLVTGGSRGIGRACAREAAECGARVAIMARGRDRLEDAADQLRTEVPEAEIVALPGDVGREAEVDRVVGAAEERLGPLDGLIHAAAVLGPIGPTVDIALEAWMDTVRINLLGTLLVVRRAVRSMRARGSGRLVLLSGGGATSPLPNYTAYGCSKAAVVRLAETLAEELAPDGITVNALAPGFVATEMHEATLEAGERAGAGYLESTKEQLREGGVPAELAARTATFLFSERAGGITGKLVAARWDAWWEWPERLAAREESDLFTLRRIVPRDRGEDWQ